MARSSPQYTTKRHNRQYFQLVCCFSILQSTKRDSRLAAEPLSLHIYTSRVLCRRVRPAQRPNGQYFRRVFCFLRVAFKMCEQNKILHLTRVFRGCTRANSGRETGLSVQSGWSASSFSFTQSRSTVRGAWGSWNGGVKKPMRIAACAFGKLLEGWIWLVNVT